MRVFGWSCRHSKDDISASFQPIWMKKRSSQSSLACEQSEIVNLTEVSRRNLVVFHLVVEQTKQCSETIRVFVPKLPACDTNTHQTNGSDNGATELTENLQELLLLDRTIRGEFDPILWFHLQVLPGCFAPRSKYLITMQRYPCNYYHHIIPYIHTYCYPCSGYYSNCTYVPTHINIYNYAISVIEVVQTNTQSKNALGKHFISRQQHIAPGRTLCPIHPLNGCVPLLPIFC